MAEQRLSEAAERLDTELTDLTAAIAHSFRSPAWAASGMAEELVESAGSALDEDARECLDHVVKSVARISELVDAVAILTDIGQAELCFEELDISAMAKEVADELLADDPSRFIDLTIQPDMRAMGDRALVRRLLGCLLDNAFKFTSKKAYGVVSVERADPLEGTPRGHVVIAVSDDGVGFDPDRAHKLFLAYQRLHPATDYDGQGLGLALARRIVGRHGGIIQGMNRPEQGASFLFSLPTRD